MDTAITDHLLTTTRAVRKRLDLDRPVEPEVVMDCLRIAQQAPTASNRQNWRWMIVADADKRRQLAELYREGGFGYLSAAATGPMDDQTRRVYESAIALVDLLPRVPIHVIPCIEAKLDNAPNWLAAPTYGSIFPAVWNFQLALRSRGLGSVLTTLHLFREKEVAALLGIPDDVTQVALLPVAYTTGTDFKPASRQPIEEIAYWDSWGS